ncbi:MULTISPECIES: AbrB family transcriptional regulator [Pseudooceanicola]|uniref:AbrB family transcriptional regulator n=1 Tax=Pseudooceanicola TaxID=1679449 RepID=UPI001EEFA57D|nr:MULTISPECIES: AbrB family transcriptional regulator [Pseudooceanicola]
MKALLRALPIALGLCLLGGIGGYIAHRLHTPLPWMLGSLFLVAIVTILRPQLLPASYAFPETLRRPFIGMIGAAIGARLTLEVLGQMPQYLYSLLALTVFVPLVQLLNYKLFRIVGGYDRPTAYFAGAPGGMIDSLIQGEEAGGDIRILAIQQFLRVIMVVTLLPVGLSIWYGHPVGSAAGVTLNASAPGPLAVPLVFVVALAGIALFQRLHIPASQLIGPMLLAGLLNLTGIVTIEAPGWLINLCQVVVGAGLGCRFAGIRPAMLVRAAGLAVLSTVMMLAIGVAMALGLAPLMHGQHVDVLLISFSPGGVTEMALIALSLNANPAVVTLHHLYRILLTTSSLVFVRKRGWFNAPPRHD